MFGYLLSMGVTHEERLAQNEAFFRDINERIRGAVEGHPADDHVYEYLCECSDTACVERIRLTTDEYEAVRSDPRALRRLLPITRSLPSRRWSRRSLSTWWCEKIGAAGELAEALDPRAA